MGCHVFPIDELHHFSRWAHCTTNQMCKNYFCFGVPGISGNFWSFLGSFFRTYSFWGSLGSITGNAFWENDDPLMANPGGMGWKVELTMAMGQVTSFLTQILGILALSAAILSSIIQVWSIPKRTERDTVLPVIPTNSHIFPTFCLTCILMIYLTYVLTFYLIFSLTAYLAVYLAFFLAV